MSRIIAIVILMMLANPLFSQVSETDESREEPEERHRITIALGHTHLAKGRDEEGGSVWLPLASWSFNYDFRISDRWAVGLQSDVVLESFFVEDNDQEDLEREKPWALVPVVIFEPCRHFGIIAGAGVELEKDENLGLTRLGVEYSLPLSKGWESGVGAVWDAKWGHYNSWAVEFSFSKSF